MSPLNDKVHNGLWRVCAHIHNWSPLPFNGEGLLPRDKALRVERAVVLLGLMVDMS